MERGDHLDGLLLLPVVVHVQLQHNLNSATTKQENKMIKHEQQSRAILKLQEKEIPIRSTVSKQQPFFSAMDSTRPALTD